MSEQDLYLNNAGAGLMTDGTLKVVIDHLRREASMGPMLAAQEMRSAVDDFYLRAANLIGGANPDEIAFMDSASRAWDMALYGSGLSRGDIIVTLSSEFGTNLVSLFHYAELIDAQIKVIDCEPDGSFPLNEISAALTAGARMIAISHFAAHASIVNPVAEIGQLARHHGALYLLDGCQALGQIPVSVSQIGCSAYTATGRKWLRGPRGTGFLYVNPSATFRTPQVDLASADLEFDENGDPLDRVAIRPDARQFELWERSLASMLGLSEAMKEGMLIDRVGAAAAISSKGRVVRRAVEDNPDLGLLGALESESGTAGFYLLDPAREDELAGRFEAAGLRISVMHDWDCPLHFPKNGATRIFRISPHYDTPDSAVEAAAEIIHDFK